MEIRRSGARSCRIGTEEWFTGRVEIDPLFGPTDASRAGGAWVTFQPGARTAWHTHPLGQALIVTAGVGWAQSRGGPVEEIRPGDVVWFGPDEMHWHGASDTVPMSHITVQEAFYGSPVVWHGKVSDADYRR
ncbi:cupin domain-containing protein [Methylobacterium sp. J-076]|uniref:(R)-mandelonitrile lyase n=1 Tax=Methylobacterium sp. J-076 TaxID=2836655 RepID=UPI001FBABDA3|nr:cupin domain-containing protein [Methylobacterium sp. J-076]MCJ2014473.1 cupin domain-containing protein [Methylobacterium sp. J-076]